MITTDAGTEIRSKATDRTAPFRVALLAHGALMVVGSGLHVWWHWLAPTLEGMQGLTAAQSDVFSLLNLAVAIVLAFFAVVSVWAGRSRTFTLTHLRGFLGLFFAVWIGRLVLELVYPVQLPVLGPETTTVLKGALVAVLALLAAPEAVRSLRG